MPQHLRRNPAAGVGDQNAHRRMNAIGRRHLPAAYVKHVLLGAGSRLRRLGTAMIFSMCGHAVFCVHYQIRNHLAELISRAHQRRQLLQLFLHADAEALQLPHEQSERVFDHAVEVHRAGLIRMAI